MPAESTDAPRAQAPPLLSQLVGRAFVHPLFDGLVIGGGLSLLVMAVVVARGKFSLGGLRFGGLSIPLDATLVLAANSAHFAASSVRLYTKPGAREALPYVCCAFPLIALALAALAIADAGAFAGALQALYLTWSPYHYGAQAYGLALIYAYRSGCGVAPAEKRALRLVALAPFAMMFLGAPNSGLAWLVPGAWLAEPGIAALRGGALQVLRALSLAGPLLLFAQQWRRNGRPWPLISVGVLLSNAIWFALVDYRDAAVWATVFHGLQYLAIAMIFHARDRVAQPGNRRSALAHQLRFYAASLALGYGLFYLLPQGFGAAGFGMVESTLMVIALINLHHFAVDAFIWRLSRGDGNRRIVERGALAAA
jgi:hypothetical protein